MRASFIQTPGDRRTRCKSCKCLRPVRSLVDGVCPTCRSAAAPFLPVCTNARNHVARFDGAGRIVRTCEECPA